MPMIQLTLPDGVLGAEARRDLQKTLAATLVKEATTIVLDAAGLSEADALRVWVLVHEQPEGTWSSGGAVVRFAELAELAALATAERENA
jgi:phenylpyruvate tautomerase PptA (4-oxalocrotonate tautomerase family)